MSIWNVKASASKQFGFRKGRTTEMAISLITTITNNALDKKLRVAGIFLDLIKGV